MAAHARLVRPGGTLILGAPNVVGVNRWFMERLAPARMAVHNSDCLRIERWDEFERRLGLERRFRSYVGGFEPRVFAVRERKTAGHAAASGPSTQLLVATAGRRLPTPAPLQPPAAQRLSHRRLARARRP